MSDAGRPIGYVALIPAGCAFAISLMMMILGEGVVAEHFNLRGPVLGARFVAALVATPLLALPWLVTAWAILRKRSRSHRIGALLFIAVLSIPGAWFLVDLVNVVFDRSKPRAHVVRFIHYVAPRRGSGYDVVTSWRQSGQRVAFTSSVSGYKLPGQRLELTVHGGALGIEYVTSVRHVAVQRGSPK